MPAWWMEEEEGAWRIEEGGRGALALALALALAWAGRDRLWRGQRVRRVWNSSSSSTGTGGRGGHASRSVGAEVESVDGACMLEKLRRVDGHGRPARFRLGPHGRAREASLQGL